MQKRAAAAGCGRNRANILRNKRILVKQQLSGIPDACEAMKKQQQYSAFEEVKDSNAKVNHCKRYNKFKLIK